MTPSSDFVHFPLPTRSEYLCTLPLWRRCLAMLNWRPVYDIELRTKLHEISLLDSERRMQETARRVQESERRMQESERRTRQLESEIAQLKESNARIARFERELFSSSTPLPSTDDSSPL